MVLHENGGLNVRWINRNIAEAESIRPMEPATSSARMVGTFWRFSTRCRDNTKIADITTKTTNNSTASLISDHLSLRNSSLAGRSFDPCFWGFNLLIGIDFWGFHENRFDLTGEGDKWHRTTVTRGD